MNNNGTSEAQKWKASSVIAKLLIVPFTIALLIFLWPILISKVHYKLIQTLGVHEDNKVWGVALSSDERRIFSSSDDNTIKIWGIDGTLLQTLSGFKDNVDCVALSPDGQKIASGVYNDTLKFGISRSGTLMVRYLKA